MYEEGEGTAEDKPKALELYLKNAKENNDGDSQYLAAAMLATGSGGRQDLEEARDLCATALQNGHPGAAQLMVMIRPTF